MFDLDGTLIFDGGGEIPPDNAALLRELAGRGHAVTLATGRMAGAARHAAESAGLRSLLVCYNGALLLDTRDDPAGRIVHREPVSPEGTAFAVGLLGRFPGEERALFLYDGDILYSNQSGEQADEYFRRSGIRPAVWRPDRPPAFASTKVLFTTTADRAAALDPLEAALAGRPDLFQVARSLPHYLEANAPGVSKGSALARLRLAYPGRTVVAFGDAGNDAEMLRAADRSIALGHAPGPIQALATHVTIPGPGGCRHAIEKILAI